MRCLPAQVCLALSCRGDHPRLLARRTSSYPSGFLLGFLRRISTMRRPLSIPTPVPASRLRGSSSHASSSSAVMLTCSLKSAITSVSDLPIVPRQEEECKWWWLWWLCFKKKGECDGIFQRLGSWIAFPSKPDCKCCHLSSPYKNSSPGFHLVDIVCLNRDFDSLSCISPYSLCSVYPRPDLLCLGSDSEGWLLTIHMFTCRERREALIAWH